MDINQQEQTCSKGGITKSQQRHLRKVAKRKAKTEERKAKQKASQEEAERQGRLIEENHNGGLYSPEFTKKAEYYYIGRIFEKLKAISEAPNREELFINYFRKYKQRYQTLVLKWSDNYPRNNSFFYLTELLTKYRDNENIYQYTLDIFSKKIKPTKF